MKIYKISNYIIYKYYKNGRQFGRRKAELFKGKYN